MCFVPIENLPYILTKGIKDGLPWLARFGCSNNVDVEPLLIKCTKDSQCPKDSQCAKTPKCPKGSQCPKDPQCPKAPLYSKCSECPKCWFFSCVDKPINVKYLPYHPGHITSVELPADNLVISGKFSGCWMGLSIDGAGIYTVYHVGTGDGAGYKCKEKFLAIKGYSYYFLPSMIIKEGADRCAFQLNLKDNGYNTDFLSDVYGIITRSYEYYSVIMGMKNKKYCVAAWIKWIVTENEQVPKDMMAVDPILYKYMPLEGELLKK